MAVFHFARLQHHQQRVQSTCNVLERATRECVLRVECLTVFAKVVDNLVRVTLAVRLVLEAGDLEAMVERTHLKIVVFPFAGAPYRI